MCFSLDRLDSRCPFWRFALGAWHLLLVGPTVDGVELTTTPSESVEAGDFANVPIILGSNRDEGTMFVPFNKSAGSCGLINQHHVRVWP